MVQTKLFQRCKGQYKWASLALKGSYTPLIWLADTTIWLVGGGGVDDSLTYITFSKEVIIIASLLLA